MNDPLVPQDSLTAQDPLTTRDLSLESLWLRSSISYLATRWLRVEGFYAAVVQDSQRAGGKVNRSRLGVQSSRLHA